MFAAGAEGYGRVVTVPLDPECALASAYTEPTRRRRLLALWRLDATLGRLAMTTREPTLAAIKLLWWRDTLAGLELATTSPDPVLRELSALILPAGIGGEELAAIEHGWAAILPGAVDADDALARHAAERGGRLFTLASTILGAAGEVGEARVRPAGEGWALVDLARRLGPGSLAERALGEARSRLAGVPPGAWRSPLRPLGMLAVLASADARRTPATLPRQGGPRRIVRMIGHRLTGY